MANKNNPKGARPLNTLAAASFNEKIHKYIVPATDTDNFFINDFVRIVNNSIDGIPIIEKGPADKAVVGVIVSFEQNVPITQTPYRKGGVQQIAHVCDDPLLTIDIQANGVLTATDIGKYADIVIGAGDIYNAISTTQLDIATISENIGVLKIISIIEKPLNEMGEYTKVRCKINEHQFNGVSPEGTKDHAVLFNLNYNAANHGNGYDGFQRGTTLSAIDPTTTDDTSKGYVLGDLWLNTTDAGHFFCIDNTLNAAVWAVIGQYFWKRIGTTISPLFTGDLLDMTPGGVKTSGNIEGGTINCIGKLTVGGVIDPTGLILTTQATPPDTSDGTEYYDTPLDRFLFREQGEWRPLGYSDIFQRILTTISPRNIGDLFDMGVGGIKTSGNIEGGTVNCIGKLTVGGVIDPTGLILTTQATPPDTSDGTEYYDTPQDRFLFREDGEWHTLGYSDIFERIGTTISPRNIGDLLDMLVGGIKTSGNIEGGTINCIGKLTVGGAIDPTGLILTTQATAPDTSDGTEYFDTPQDRFLFRENSEWHTLGYSDIFERIGTTISPRNIGDLLDMLMGGIKTSGNIEGGTVNCIGKLTVGGIIDPTGLVLATQATAPDTSDGTEYFDTPQDRFLFRENSEWHTLGYSDIFERIGTTISPRNIGDLFDMTPGGVKTSGNIEGGTINCIGKLTVGGVIDPTGLILATQATPPDTSDGTQYYDTPQDRFLFREQTEWRTVGYSDIWKRTVTDVSLRNAGDTTQFDGTGGIKFDLGGQVINLFDTDGTLSADSDNRVPTQKAVKTYVDASPTIGKLWTTVGPIGSDADYNSIEDARAAGKLDLLIVKDFTETQDIAIATDQMQITITEQLNMDDFVFNLTTGSIKITGGRLTGTYTSANHKMIEGGASGDIFLDNIDIDLSASSGSNAGITTQSGGTLQVNNCNIFLADSAESGFQNPPNKSQISNCIFTGGGTSCEKPIEDAVGCIISDCTFFDTFKTNNQLITTTTTGGYLSNINYAGSVHVIIATDAPYNAYTNIKGLLTIEVNGTSYNFIANSSIGGIKATLGSRYNYFANMHLSEFDTVISGDDNRFVNCYFEEDVTVSFAGDNNTLLSCIVLGTYSDVGSNNSYINEISEDGTFASATDRQLATALAIKTYVDATHGTPEQEVLPVTTPGQTSFTLSNTPKAQKGFFLWVNGQVRRYGVSYDYTFSGTTLTWNDPGGFTLDTTDELIAGYDY